MANINGEVSVQVTDAYGITGTTNYDIIADDTKTLAQLMTDVASLASAETALTQGGVNEYSVRLIHTPTEPVSGTGDIEKGGLFNFSNATDSFAQGYWIPDIQPSVLNANGLIDLTNTSVTDFITFLTTAHTVITVVTKGVRALSALKDALISFRKHRKPLARKTKEV